MNDTLFFVLAHPNEAAARIEALEAALRIIAGYEQCIDNLMSNQDVARAALALEQDK